MFTHMPCGNSLFNFYASKHENHDEMDGYLENIIINIIFNNIMKPQLTLSKIYTLSKLVSI